MFDLKKIDINRIADKANFSRNTTIKSFKALFDLEIHRSK